MYNGWRFLSNTRISGILEELNENLFINRPLIFLMRTAVVDASDDEIMGKYTGSAFIADIIADDQEALTYESGSMRFVINNVPNLKIGVRVGQAMINLMYALEQANRGLTPNERRLFRQWEGRMASDQLEGIRQRMNQLCCAMELDELVYDRFGMKITAGWGTPSLLKAVVATTWDTAATATPIADLMTMNNQTAPDNYGKSYNRATMSSRAFNYLVKTVEFRNLISGQREFNFQAGQLNVLNSTLMRTYFESISGLVLELYDGQYKERAANGAMVQQRVCPSNMVILTNSDDDNVQSVRDFANGVVTESIVGSMGAYRMEGFNGPRFGPIAYYIPKQDLNPPVITCWGVARGFPRKHDEFSTATLEVGAWV